MQLPLNRVRSIINLDDENSLIAKDALVLISKATELFIQDLAGVNAINARHSKRKTLQVQDILIAADTTDRFYFIKDSMLPSLKPEVLHL